MRVAAALLFLCSCATVRTPPPAHEHEYAVAADADADPIDASSASLAPPDGWRSWSSPDGDFTIWLPASPPPSLRPESTGMQLVAVTELAGATFNRTPNQILARCRPATCRAVEHDSTIGGVPAHHIRLHYLHELGAAMDDPFDEEVANLFFHSFRISLAEK